MDATLAFFDEVYTKVPVMYRQEDPSQVEQ